MTQHFLSLAVFVTGLGAVTTPALSDDPRIEGIQTSRSGMGWRFDVTLSHPDTGWDHYADGWEVTTPDGKLLGARKLHHPHVAEQPFTRSLGRVSIPPGTDFIVVRARDSVHEYGGKEFRIDLPEN